MTGFLGFPKVFTCVFIRENELYVARFWIKYVRYGFRAMRNRGVEIFMSNSLSTSLWGQGRRCEKEEGRTSTLGAGTTSIIPMDEDTVAGNNCPSREQNDNTSAV